MTGTTTSIDIATLSNGHHLALTLHRIEGSRPGPTFGISGGIHGDEQLGLEIVRRIAQAIDPSELSGTVLVVPASNPYSFQADSRNNPIDQNNLNRVFPGGGEGWITEKVAQRLCTEFLDHCDFFLDVHSGGSTRTVEYSYLDPQHREFSAAFGSRVLFHSKGYGGASSSYTRERNIPTVVAELGGGQQDNDGYIAKGVRGALNLLRAAGMLPGKPKVDVEQVVVDELVAVRPRHGGMMVSELRRADMNTVIPGGTEMGRVISPYTFETLDVLTAPFESTFVIVVQVTGTLAEAGGYGFMAANAGTAVPFTA